MYSPGLQISRITIIALLMIGVLWVLRPFLSPLLTALIIVVATWKPYSWLVHRLGNRKGLAAALMTLLLTVCILIPTFFLGGQVTKVAAILIESIKVRFQDGLGEPPLWLASLPILGDHVQTYWEHILNDAGAGTDLLQRIYDPAKRLITSIASGVANGVLQILLAIFIAFFAYRDGEQWGLWLRNAARRLSGDIGLHMVNVAGNTIIGVMVGILGTAAAQGLVAYIGFKIAGVPNAGLLGAATFLTSMLPAGPVLIWLGAAYWLYDQSLTGWAIFMVVWGAAGISSVDNVVRPMLIAHTASLPFLLIALGTFGGIIGFGFVGIFIGPTLLALAVAITHQWLNHRNPISQADRL
ncbi:MAG: AI-2E family transporter [Fluviibacter sp.]